MREVIISIQPRWVEKIVSGEKTVEVRRTRPKCETPFKCYIYETKDKKFEGIGSCGFRADGERYNYIFNGGKVIGEFICDKIVKFPHDPYDPSFSETADLSCVGIDGLSEYLGHKDYGYGWHITDLVIYDEPRELSEFYTHCCSDKGYSNIDCGGCAYYQATSVYTGWCVSGGYKPITRAPQSWQFCVATEPRQTAD